MLKTSQIFFRLKLKKNFAKFFSFEAQKNIAKFFFV